MAGGALSTEPRAWRQWPRVVTESRVGRWLFSEGRVNLYPEHFGGRGGSERRHGYLYERKQWLRDRLACEEDVEEPERARLLYGRKKRK